MTERRAASSVRRKAEAADADPVDPAALTFREVTARTWPAFGAFFEEPGAPKHCWCMIWRRTKEEAKLQKGADRKRMMKERIESGMPVGLLAYVGERAVGWVSIGPRAGHVALGGVPPGDGEKIWSLTCFFVPRRLRRQKLTHALIAGAVDHARKSGATIVEAYPVDPTSPSYRHMGFIAAFRKAGFKPLGPLGIRRHVMRLAVAGDL